MNSIVDKPMLQNVSPTASNFDVLDLCHRETIFALGKLAAVMTALQTRGADDEVRALAAEVVRHFSTMAREHHQDEERHIFPKMLESGKPELVRAVQRLRQDHGWLEEDWLELSAQLDAVASGQGWYDLDVLREGVSIFIALSHEHIALEESLIYPHARAHLHVSELGEMGREMSARRRVKH